MKRPKTNISSLKKQHFNLRNSLSICRFALDEGLHIEPLLTTSAICPKVTHGHMQVTRQFAGSSQQWQRPVDHRVAVAVAEEIYGG
jgi:hypothetical protein